MSECMIIDDDVITPQIDLKTIEWPSIAGASLGHSKIGAVHGRTYVEALTKKVVIPVAPVTPAPVSPAPVPVAPVSVAPAPEPVSPRKTDASTQTVFTYYMYKDDDLPVYASTTPPSSPVQSSAKRPRIPPGFEERFRGMVI